MTDLSSITGQATSTGVTSGLTDSNAVDDAKTQFLTLLIAQLQNQDPMSPMDTDQMTAQMMSMGQLEQLFNLNENVTNLVNVSSTSQIANFSSMVGKSALSKGNTFQISGADNGTITFKLNEVPETTLIRVFDKYGNIAREFNHDVQISGLQEVPFDGLGLKGNELEDGYYTYTVEALNKEGSLVSTQTYSTGVISSIRLENGSPIFQMGNNDVSASDIEKIF